jgi:hypothetical protein
MNQEQLYTQWRLLCAALTMKGNVIQNDIARLKENGMTKEDLKDMITTFSSSIHTIENIKQSYKDILVFLEQEYNKF